MIVSIPTTNRPEVVVPTVLNIARQTRLPDLLLIVIASEKDIDPIAIENMPFPVSIIVSERGLTTQRNAALETLKSDDLLLFLDDDFVMAPDYLANLERLFLDNPEVAMATGTVLADGIHGPGLTHRFGQDLASRGKPRKLDKQKLQDVYNCYGCNMSLRAKHVVAQQIRFDQRLKMYGWLEDVDFSRQMAKFGRIVESQSLVGVHLGTKTGRSNGFNLGYSQVANPFYLNGKGTMAPLRAMNIVGRNLFSNLARSLYPEPEIDRWGRLKGNFKALGDLIRGRLKPERILEF
ncbi:glycosyltransferase [Rhodobacteraceae bacterium D3-12]|nr:glycosyltransferase [Rhodobacteraceae bacterium D3-12]